MSILKVSQPEWAQQRTIIPQNFLTPIRSGQAGGTATAVRPGATSQPDKRDTVPAMLREGEEVITPETKAAMGGRQAMIDALNSKLAPKGLAIKANRPPVTQMPNEQQMCGGTMQVQGYARGTAQLQAQPGYYPGAIFSSTNTNGLGQDVQYPRNARGQQQQPSFSNGTMGIAYKNRQGFALGSITIPKVTIPKTTVPTVTTPTTTNTDAGKQAGVGVDITPVSGTTTATDLKNTATTPQVNTSTVSVAPKSPTVTSTVATTPQAIIPTVTTQTTTPTAATIPAATTPVQAPAINAGTKGIGYNVQDVTQSPYYKTQEQVAREAIQKQGGVAAMQQAQNLAQQGVGQNTAAGRTLAAEQQAGTQSSITQAETQLGLQAQAQTASDLQNAMTLAYNSGDWGSVNSILAKTGQQPIDFTNLEQQRQSGNLQGAAQTLFNLANSITGTDAQSIATKSALSNEATGLVSKGLKTVLGNDYNPEALTAAANAVDTTPTDPTVQTFVDHVASAPLNWVQYTPSGQLFTNMLSNNADGEALLAAANKGDTTAIKTLATLSVYAASNVSGTPMNQSMIDFLNKYGVYIDWSSVSAADRAYQEGAMNAATSMSYGLSPMSSSNNPSLSTVS